MTMSFLISLAILGIVGVAVAAPQRSIPNVREPVQNSRLVDPREAQLLHYEAYNDGLGAYKFVYEQNDGQAREEQGVLRNPNTDNESLAVQGSYSWVGPDEVTYLVRYTADENGFKPIIEQGPGGAVPTKVIESLLG